MIIIIIISLMESLISRHLHTLDKNNGVIILYALYNTSQEIYIIHVRVLKDVKLMPGSG